MLASAQRNNIQFLSFDILQGRTRVDGTKEKNIRDDHDHHQDHDHLQLPPHIQDHIHDCTAVVHAMGTLLDGDGYKQLAKAKSIPEMLSAVGGAKCPMELMNRISTGNPLGYAQAIARSAVAQPSTTTTTTTSTSSTTAGNYERMNRDSGIIVM